MSSREAPTDSAEVLSRINEGLPWVDSLARRLGREFGRAATFDELVSYGREGLLAAARTFDDARGVPFRSWVTLKARGAMIDGLRSSGQLPRRMYKQLRAFEAATHVEATLAEETRAAGPMSAEQADARLDSNLATMATAMAVGLLAPPISMEDRDFESEGMSPEEQVAQAELVQRVRDAIARLPDSERHLVDRHYFGGVTLDEAAREQGLSKSWGSRLHARAIESIARELKRTRALP